MPNTYTAQRRGVKAAAPARRTLAALIIVGGAAVGALACNPSTALKVPEPDNVQPQNITSAAALPALRNATLSAFQIAYSGGADVANSGHEGQVGMSALLSDEMQDQETFTSRIQIDGRIAGPGNGSLYALFIDLSSARAFADRADVKYNQFAPNDPNHSLVLAIGGFVYTLFAENWCEGVPASTFADNGTIMYGQPMTRQQLLQTAIQRFDSAIALANTNGDVTDLSLAQVGLGRALLDSNDDANAAVAVAAVPQSYVFDIGASTNTSVENNGIWNYTINTTEFGMADHKGGNGLPYVSANDPRTPFLDTGAPGVDQGADFIQQQLYPQQAAPTPLATGIEAKLIAAEHQLRTGNSGAWIATLNALRATVPGLAATPLADPGSPVARVNLMFSERAFWLYLTSHRLGDMRRLIRQYGRNSETVFPTGVNPKGGTFGTDVNFAVPGEETANPNFHGCLNRSA